MHHMRRLVKLQDLNLVHDFHGDGGGAGFAGQGRGRAPRGWTLAAPCLVHRTCEYDLAHTAHNVTLVDALILEKQELRMR